MRWTRREKIVVGLADRLFGILADLMEEVALPFSLLSRWMLGRMPLWMAWDILWSTWAPFRIVQRWHGRCLVWKDRRYRGHDEFHPSLAMNVRAMLTMDKVERKNTWLIWPGAGNGCMSLECQA
jgi:hypothetical protein